MCCEGIELRKVEEHDEDDRQDPARSGGVGGLFDVQMILEMRRRVLEGEEDSDDDESVDDWDD